MIVKIHGTSGSGKTTLAREFLTSTKPFKNAKGKIEYYQTQSPSGRSLYVLGSYENICGGCDGLSPTDTIELLHKTAILGDVLYEGLIISEYYGKVGEASERYRKEHVFAFLDTPIELCIERVKKRRLQMGNTKPFNEQNTRERVRKIDMLRKRLQFMGRPVVILNYERAEEQLRALLQNGYEVYRAS